MLNIYAQSMLTATRLETLDVKEVQGKGVKDNKRRKWWRKPSLSIDLTNL